VNLYSAYSEKIFNAFCTCYQYVTSGRSRILELGEAEGFKT